LHQWELHIQINHRHIARLDALSCVPGFGGSRECGVRMGHLPPDPTVVADTSRSVEDDEPESGSERGDLSGDEVTQDALNVVTDFIENSQ